MSSDSGPESSSRMWKSIGGILVVMLAMTVLSVRACNPAKTRGAIGWERYFYPTLKGRVVDAQTGEPIEGAVVLNVWMIVGGLPGLTHTDIYKKDETTSAKDGTFTIPGTWHPFVDRHPELSVYKRGYALWNNLEIFPGREMRGDFRWEDGLVVKLDRWQQGYSFFEHEDFISLHSHDSHYKHSDSSLHKASEWERPFAIKERNALFNRKNRHGDAKIQ